jgi:hypothetical protein
MIVDHIKVRETLIFDSDATVRITHDGYMTARPRVARTGIQIYSGKELGRPEMDRVRVYRPADQVFDTNAMASLAHRPITNDHPREAVTAENWKKYAVGQVGDEVARDGEFIRVPLVLMDAEVISAVKDGKREISLGYDANLEWRAGVTDQNEQYDAVQTSIRINHLAIVDAARGGPKLVVGDNQLEGTTLLNDTATQAKKLIEAGNIDDRALELGGEVLYLVTKDGALECKYPIGRDSKVYRRALEAAIHKATESKDEAVMVAATALLTQLDQLDQKRKAKKMNDKTRTITIDGISLELIPDTAAAVIERALKAADAQRDTFQKEIDSLKASTAKLQTDHATHVTKSETDLKAKDAEIATLKKQVEDGKLTPDKLDQLVKDRFLVIGKARAMIGDKLTVEGKSDADMRKQVVLEKLGDVAKTWDDAQIKVSFDTLTAGVKVEDGQVVGSSAVIAHDFSRPGSYSLGDNRAADLALEKYNKTMANNWKSPPQQH